MIEIIGVSKRFDGQEVLRGLHLTIPDRQITALIGRSGGGKSVLIKLIVGLLRPDEGRVLVDGVDVAELSGPSLLRLRERVGFLFQGGALFDSATVLDNLAFPLREKTHLGEHEIAARVRRALEEVGLAGAGHKYPAELSGGMQKRVALARALIRDPAIALFDEPTTGLDPVLLRSIQRLIARAYQRLRYTGVLVSHDVPEVFDVAHTVAMLHEGVIVARGTPAELRASADPVVRHFLDGDDGSNELPDAR